MIKTFMYRKVSLEGFGPSVRVVSTDLTVVVDVQTMEFIEPVRDRLEEQKHSEYDVNDSQLQTSAQHLLN